MGKIDLKKRFGAAVRGKRDNLGISQEELAGRSGLHRTYISDVERGARNVSLESIHRLATALQVSISTLFSQVEETLAGSSAPALSPDELVEILIVEDSSEDAELAIKALKDVHLSNRIHVVRDGAAALDFLFNTGEHGQRRHGNRPQLILLDLGLPKIDGLEVLRRIKADPRTRTIPVIVLTASNRDRDIAASRRLGAEAYLVKPVDFQNLSEVTPQLSLQWALLKPAPMLGV